MRIALYIVGFCLAVVACGIFFHILTAFLNLNRDVAFAISVALIFAPAFFLYGFARHSGEVESNSVNTIEGDRK